MGKIKTQGTDLYVVSSPTTAVKLACITSFSGLGGPRDQIETTCFSSVEKEYEGGMATPGQITVGGNYDTADSVFTQLLALKDSGDLVEWYLGGNDATTAPTVAAGVITAPAGRTASRSKGTCPTSRGRWMPPASGSTRWSSSAVAAGI